MLKTLMTREQKLHDAFMSGVATALCAEFIEVLKYIDGAAPYAEPYYGHLADAIIRELGVPLVTGDIPGVAVILGEAPTAEEAVELVKALSGTGYPGNSGRWHVSTSACRSGMKTGATAFVSYRLVMM